MDKVIKLPASVTTGAGKTASDDDLRKAARGYPTAKPANADLLTTIDLIERYRIGSGDAYHEALVKVRAAVADLIERERQQREILEALCGTYIANRHAIDEYGFVKCVTTAGNRLSDTEIGRTWLRAEALVRVGGAK